MKLEVVLEKSGALSEKEGTVVREYGLLEEERKEAGGTGEV